MNNRVQNFSTATKPLFEEIERALQTRPIDVNVLLQKLDSLHKQHLILTKNAATLREQCSEKDNGEYVNKTVQAISNILSQTGPSFTSGSPLQRLRNMALDHVFFIGIDKLAVLEIAILRKFLNALVKLFKVDNEENCLLGLKIIFNISQCIDLTASTHLAFTVVYVLEEFFIKSIQYYNHISLEACLKIRVNDSNTLKALLKKCHSPVLLAGPKQQKVMVLPRASNSLQVLAEIPQVLSCIMEQWHLGYGYGEYDLDWNEVVDTFLKIINLKCDAELRAKPNFCKDTYMVFLKLQISSLEFLLYVQFLRKEITLLDDIERLFSGFFSLLKNCPPNAISLQRKLVKLLHVILSVKFIIGERNGIGKEFTASDFLIRGNHVQEILLDNFLYYSDPTPYSDPAPYNDVRASYFNILLKFFRKEHSKFDEDLIRLIMKYFLPAMHDSMLPEEIHKAICLLLKEFEKRRRENENLFQVKQRIPFYKVVRWTTTNGRIVESLHEAKRRIWRVKTVMSWM